MAGSTVWLEFAGGAFEGAVEANNVRTASIVDGRAVVSCAQPAGRFEDRDVLTLEGLSAEARAAWADSLRISPRARVRAARVGGIAGARSGGQGALRVA